MEKLTSKIKALPHDATYFSMEFFPPKTAIGSANLLARLERIASQLQPLFVAVTWGAGGCTSSKSLELAEMCQKQLGLTTCLHLTCTNMVRDLIDQTLEKAKALGIRNILALRGDPPRTHEYGPDPDEDEDDLHKHTDSNEQFTRAIDLVRYIKLRHGDFFCVGVAAYPEGHTDVSYPERQDPLDDLSYLIEKTKAGADFILTQLFYDCGAYLKFEHLLRQHESGVFRDIPIIPGLMPIQNYEILKRTSKLAHITLPAALETRLSTIRGDDEAVKTVGIETLSEIVQSIKSCPAPGPRGFHFFTLNLEKAVTAILERTNLVQLIDQERETFENSEFETPIENGSFKRQRTFSSSSSPGTGQLTTNSHRSASHTLQASPLCAINGTLPVSREASWDDFPNGRFGDARSPAFNAPIAYAPTSLPVTPQSALRLWNLPKTYTDISNLFVSHLKEQQPPRLPWSESATLSPETTFIKDQLTALTLQKRYWTIASQPSVDGLSSKHPVHGWGPLGGFVFQKTFVEFFASMQEFLTTLQPCLDRLHGEGQISYYAYGPDNVLHTSESPNAVHAVTWGSFKGKEITTATMVEDVSFRAWGQEAFDIWTEWSRCIGELGRQYRPGTKEREAFRASREFLEQTRQELVLVNVIGHDYKHSERLWDLLMAC